MVHRSLEICRNDAHWHMVIKLLVSSSSFSYELDNVCDSYASSSYLLTVADGFVVSILVLLFDVIRATFRDNWNLE